MHWHRVIPSPGANVYSKGTGSFHHPVPLMHGSFGTGSWYQPMPLFVHWHRFVSWHALPALGASQKYRLLLQPVPMPCISTGCNMRWYFWPGPLARFPVVNIHMVIDLRPQFIFQMNNRMVQPVFTFFRKVFRPAYRKFNHARITSLQ